MMHLRLNMHTYKNNLDFLIFYSIFRIVIINDDFYNDSSQVKF